MGSVILCHAVQLGLFVGVVVRFCIIVFCVFFFFFFGAFSQFFPRVCCLRLYGFALTHSLDIA